jgi:hypothetical protein
MRLATVMMLAATLLVLSTGTGSSAAHSPPSFRTLGDQVFCNFDMHGHFWCNRLADGLYLKFDGTRVVIAHGHSRAFKFPLLRSDGFWRSRNVWCLAGSRGLVYSDDSGTHGWWMGRLGGLAVFGPSGRP